MGAFEAARIIAEGDVAEQSSLSPFIFGGAGFLALVVLLIVTTMINVDR